VLRALAVAYLSARHYKLREVLDRSLGFLVANFFLLLVGLGLDRFDLLLILPLILNSIYQLCYELLGLRVGYIANLRKLVVYLRNRLVKEIIPVKLKTSSLQYGSYFVVPQPRDEFLELWDCPLPHLVHF